MAVLFLRQAGETARDGDRPTGTGHFGVLDGLVRLMTGPLPDDVPPSEYTDAFLFRCSLILNYITGGSPEMTFSARCHRSARVSRSFAGRAFWRGIAGLVDILCACLRGEHAHCATAWANHRARKA